MGRDSLNDLRQIAERLQPQLKSSGPAPQIPHIMAAILIARDSFGSRAACRAIQELPEGVHVRVGKLAERVRPLLAAFSPAILTDVLTDVLTDDQRPPDMDVVMGAEAAITSAVIDDTGIDQPELNLPPPPDCAGLPWTSEQPPRLREDFGGELGRDAYERARVQWFRAHGNGRELLPQYDPIASASARRAQLSARAALWDSAVRAWKDRQRDRSDRIRPDNDKSRRLRHAHRAKQLAWAEQVIEIADDANVPNAVDLMWPASKWRTDLDQLTALAEFVTAHPPTGDDAWCAIVESRAAELFLGSGEYWDDAEAAGYRMVTSLPGTPDSLCNLPMGDRLWVRWVNERIGFVNFIRSTAMHGHLHNAIDRIYSLALSQFEAQRDHHLGISDQDIYMSTIGFCPDTPICPSYWLAKGSDLVLSPKHPRYQPVSAPQIRSLERPRTLKADASYSISPHVRKCFEDQKLQKCIQRKYAHTLMSLTIPYGDLYKHCSIVQALQNYVWDVGSKVVIDLNRVMCAGILNWDPDIAQCEDHTGSCLALPISRIADTAEPGPGCVVRDVPEHGGSPPLQSSPSPEHCETTVEEPASHEMEHDPLADMSDADWAKTNARIRELFEHPSDSDSDSDNDSYRRGGPPRYISTRSSDSNPESDSDETRHNAPFEHSSLIGSKIELHRVLEAQLASLSKFVGMRVELHSLTRNELNGRHGEILPLNAQAPGRVPVRLDGNVPAISVKAQNIFILRPDESAASDDNERC